MEVVEPDTGDSAPDPGRNGLARITDKVWHTEELGHLLRVLLVTNLEVPAEGRIYLFTREQMLNSC